MARSRLAAYRLRLAVSDQRLRAALHSCRDAVLAPTAGEVMCMDRKGLQSIAEALVATILEDEIDWIAAHSIACRIQLTEDEHVYLLDFERLPDAERFQRVWGGEFRGQPGLQRLH